MKESRYVTLEEAAQKLSRSAPWVKSRLLEGVLEAKLEGNRWLISSESLKKCDLTRLPSDSEPNVHNFLPERSSKKAERPIESRKRVRGTGRAKPHGGVESRSSVRGRGQSSAAGEATAGKRRRRKGVVAPSARLDKDNKGSGVSRVVARNYIYERIAELKQELLYGNELHRVKADRVLAFLEGQIKLVNQKNKSKRVRLDPSLEREVLEYASRPPRSVSIRVPKASSSRGKAPTKSMGKKVKKQKTKKRKKDPDLPWSGGYSNRNTGWGYPYW